MRPFLAGAVAQLIERLVRNEEVAGLSPVCSTSFRRWRKLPCRRLAEGGPLIISDLGESCGLALPHGAPGQPLCSGPVRAMSLD